MQGTAGPTVTVFNGSTLLLAGLDVRLNGSELGLQTSGVVALDTVEIASNNGGGISAGNTAEVLIRNSIVTANGINQTEDAITLNGATATVLYSSILLKRWGSGQPLTGCGTATITNSYNDSIDNATGLLWFDGWAGDLRLLAAGQATFTGVAQWQTGDPPTDIDGTPRPTTDGSADVCGAPEAPTRAAGPLVRPGRHHQRRISTRGAVLSPHKSTDSCMEIQRRTIAARQ